MSSKRKVLVINVDIDNDLGEKAKVKGPIIGKKDNVSAASRLALADAEDSDVNAIFQAVRIFEELEKGGEQAEVVTLTGNSNLGYQADREIVHQLEEVISLYSPDSCIFVSDGASDERILPLIQSRLRLDAVRTVIVKQQKDLEKTYFVILDKLREPQTARLVFGIPGLALMLLAFSEVIGIKLLVGLLGAYLILKGLGMEEFIFKRLSTFQFSFDKVPFIFYFASVPLAIVSLWIAVSKVNEVQLLGVTSGPKVVAWFLKDLLLLLPISLLLIVIGNTLGAMDEKKNYLLPRYLTQACTIILLWFIFNNASDWVIGTLSFSDFFYSTILGVAAMYLVIVLSREFKKSIISQLRLEGKEVYTEIGGRIGKIVGIRKNLGSFIIETQGGQKFDLEFDHISNLGEKVIVKY